MWGPQRPKFGILAEDFGFWGFWILGILDFGDFGFWGRNSKSKIQNPNFFGRFWGFWILDRYVAHLYVASNFGDFGFWGFWILDLGDFGFWIWGFRILDLGDFGDFGYWILGILDFGPLCSKSLCEAPNAPNLGDFGFWGFGILDFVTNFGFYIRRRRLCTPIRVGGFSCFGHGWST